MQAGTDQGSLRPGWRVSQTVLTETEVSELDRSRSSQFVDNGFEGHLCCRSIAEGLGTAGAAVPRKLTPQTIVDEHTDLAVV